jgi:hypothetical protein
MWSRFCRQLSFFVPKGLSDGSLAVYCQGLQETNPSRRERYDWGWKERSSTSNRERASRPTQTVPYGTGLF